MEAYLVRLKVGQPHEREIVGIYVACSMEHLFWLVDDCTSPEDCEYIELGPGGIYWSRYTGQRVPRAVEPDWESIADDWSAIPTIPQLTDEWDQAFAADGPATDEAWQPVVLPDDEPLVPSTSGIPDLPPRVNRSRRKR